MKCLVRTNFDELLVALAKTTGPRSDPTIPPLRPFGALDLRGSVEGLRVGQLVLRRFMHVSQPLCVRIVALAQDDAQGEYYEPVAPVNVVLPQHPLEPGTIFAKTYGENEPIREPLLRSGLFLDTGTRVKEWFTSIEVWQLTPEFYTQCGETNRATFARLRELGRKAA